MKLSGADIRSRFIRFFEAQHGHQHLPSASLIPTNPTVLLTPAGMLPFVPIFLGIEPPPKPPRVVTVQKCARVSGKASDLEYVGRTSRHHTFFEMLGNFSFGDYFKEDVIPWAWDFITREMALPVDRLWVTVFTTDDEAAEIWQRKAGVKPERILRRGEKDNFWGPPGPTGPCGPCSEIFFDRGEQYSCSEQCGMEYCECDRFVEVWNLVFMQYFKDAEGNVSPLEKKNVDTGMGLERIAMVMQEVGNTFETDLLFPILKKVGDLTGHRYHENPETDVWLKIVTDHVRCVSFAISDGIVPSNEGRGYIIRMILRRAIRYAKKLGMQEPMLFKLISTVRDLYQEAYPELKTQYQHIVDTMKAEEKRFLETLERGTKMLDDVVSALKAQGIAEIPGEEVFKLYDTYGFPLELTREMADEKGLTIDEAGFETAMTSQREKARASQGDKTLVTDQVFAEILRDAGATKFLGYDTLDAEAKIVALLHEGKRVDSFGGTNQPFEVILDQTPFYGESGGQVGDKGILYVANGEHAQTIVVKDTQKVGDLFVHKCLFDQGGSISVGTTVMAEVSPDLRARTMRHHSVTHLVQAALKRILGEHVSQAGSYVGPDGARFDFTFPRGMKPEEIHQTEMLVNQWILQNISREVKLTDMTTAKADGAIAMFNEKYGDTVRVVSFGGHSKELCGGTHVERLGDIGLFKITSEGAIASGIRRLEFVAGELALHQMMATQTELEKTAAILKVAPREISERVERLLEEKKTQEKQLKAMEEKMALAQVHELIRENEGLSSKLVEQVDVESGEALKFMADTLVQRLPEHLIFLGATISGKAQFIAAVPKRWQDKGFKAGELVKNAAVICEGGGGGKPNFAQAGGKQGHKVKEALGVIREHLEKSAETISG
jgi:alanyl-tRNA synthetase